MEAAVDTTDFNFTPVQTADNTPVSEFSPAAPASRPPKTDAAGRFFYGDPETAGRGDSAMVQFYWNSAHECHFIRKRFPGDRCSAPDRPVTPYDRELYARQWEAYLSNEDQLKGQTRIRDCEWLDVGQKDNLFSNRIQTVEQLAGVTDNGLPALGPGARKLRDKAKDFLRRKSHAEKAHAIAQQLEQEKARNEKLSGEVAELRKLMQDMLAKQEEVAKAETAVDNADPQPPNKRGRPPKQAAPDAASE